MPQAAKQTPAASGLVNLRMSAQDRSLIDRAARAAGKTRTQFMLEAARKAAHETLLDTNLIVVDEAAFESFSKLFAAPAKPNARLRALVAQKAPWDA